MRILRPLVRLTAKITIHHHEVIPLRYDCANNRFLHVSASRYDCDVVESAEYAAATGNIEHTRAIFAHNKIRSVADSALRNCQLRVLKYLDNMGYRVFDRVTIRELPIQQQRQLYHAFGGVINIMRAIEIGIPRIMRLWLDTQNTYYSSMDIARRCAKRYKRKNFVKLFDALIKPLPKSGWF